ncbi:hypothetical protein [Phenylobacterium sp.]|uniref:hypothetical protein n=1 Tax=Phenylobacterium sp. TaxID=1871053 RepID=UPI0035B1CF21
MSSIAKVWKVIAPFVYLAVLVGGAAYLLNQHRSNGLARMGFSRSQQNAMIGAAGKVAQPEPMPPLASDSQIQAGQAQMDEMNRYEAAHPGGSAAQDELEKLKQEQQDYLAQSRPREPQPSDRLVSKPPSMFDDPQPASN